MNNKFIRFIIVGMVNTAFGYSVFALLLYLNVHYSVAVLLSTILGIIFNFKTTGKLVFKVNNNILIFKFVGVYTITYFLNVIFLKVLNSYKISMFVAGGLILIPMSVISFTLNKKFVFKE